MALNLAKAVRGRVAGGKLEKAVDFTLKHLKNNDEVLAIKIQFVESKKAFYSGLISFDEFKKSLTGITLWLLQVVKDSTPQGGE